MAEGNNTKVLTALLQTIDEAMVMANDELQGFLPATKKDASVAKIAKGETIKLWDIKVPKAKEYTQSMTIPDGEDLDAETSTMTINEQWAVNFNFAGEEQAALSHQGYYNDTMRLAFYHAFNEINTQIEHYIAQTVIAGASRACGTIGTVPFNTANDFSDLADLGLIFDQNGTPRAQRQLILNSYSMANIRGKMSNLFNVEKAGTTDLLRTGLLAAPIQGFSFWQSAALDTPHESGISAGLVPTKAYVAGDHLITLQTGSGDVNAGDVITFGSDTTRYVAMMGTSGAGTIEIGRPGLIKGIGTSDAIKSSADYTPNVAFQRDAVIVGMRTPYIPDNGDAAIDRTYKQSAYGIPYMISVYGGHGKNMIEVATCYDCKVLRPANVALLVQ